MTLNPVSFPFPALFLFWLLACPHPGRGQQAIISPPPILERANTESVKPLLLEGVHHLGPGALPVSRNDPGLPKIFAPTQTGRAHPRFPWKRNIVTTVFWIGEKPTPRNPTPNTASSWDTDWDGSYGGYDDPNPGAREGWIPSKFTPQQNPFYVALPYNDVVRLSSNAIVTKSSARESIPWFEKAFYRSGKTVLKGRWIAIRRGSKFCYGQWEDCGPFETDNWEYVFGEERPRTTGNGGAGLDVSPAIRDFLGFKTRAKVDWRFVELHEVPDGPWKNWGTNNPFVNRTGPEATVSESIAMLREIRKKLAEKKKAPAEEQSAE